jgi:flagellar biogenesis protein FliO
MRSRNPPAWVFFIGCIVAPLVSVAQQSGALIPPRLTPITLDEPRAFSAATAVEAQPLRQAYPQAFTLEAQTPTPRVIHPPVNFRLASAEEPVYSQAEKSPRRLAPRSEASRQPLAKPAVVTPAGTLGTVAGSLGIVLGLFLLIAWCSRRLSPTNASVLPKEAVELLGRAPLAARQQVQLVRIGNKLLLLALSPVGVETLTEITEPTEVEHLLTLCRRGQPGSSSTAFLQTLSQLAQEPAERGFVGATQNASRGGR